MTDIIPIIAAATEPVRIGYMDEMGGESPTDLKTALICVSIVVVVLVGTIIFVFAAARREERRKQDGKLRTGGLDEQHTER